MKKFNYTLTALFTASLLISCGDSSSMNSWSSQGQTTCVEEIISNFDLEMDDVNELGIDPDPIALCMCGVFEQGFDSWEKCDETIEDPDKWSEWAINHETLALEAAGCLLSAFGDMDLSDVDFSGLIDEDFEVDFDAVN